jgi:hypothetical protein
MQIDKTTQMKNRVLKPLPLALLLMVSVFTGAAAAQTPSGISRSTGMFGLTQNQTARLNVVRDDPFFRDEPFIKVELSFVDGDGNILAQKVYDLGAGKAAFLDLKGLDVLERQPSRTQIRAVVRFVGTPDTRLAENCIPTLEVFDNDTRETRFLLPAVQKVQVLGIE